MQRLKVENTPVKYVTVEGHANFELDIFTLLIRYKKECCHLNGLVKAVEKL